MKRIAFIFAIMALSSTAAVAQTGPAKPGSNLNPKQVRQAANQINGSFPKIKNASIPLGQINEAWAGANCTNSDSLRHIAYMPDEQINISVRQVVGTVVHFPEPVRLMVSGVGENISVNNYPNGNKETPSRFWVFGVHRAGTDGNFVFIGGGGDLEPRLYHFRIQGETIHSKNCPITFVRIRGAVSPHLTAAIQEFENVGETPALAKSESERVSDPQEPVSPVQAEGKEDLTGRPNVDWLQKKEFDPAQISFDWDIFGEETIAPDVVYSDCCFLYLHYNPERQPTVSLPAISIVEKIDSGFVDSPVDFTVRGTTIVVRAKGPVTLEREGLVTCVRPRQALAMAPNKDQWGEGGRKGSSASSRPIKSQERDPMGGK